jgi:hypothetical protein
MLTLRKRIERLEARKPTGASALSILTEDPTSEAPAVERCGDILIRRLGAGASLDDDAISLDLLFPLGTEREREAYLGGTLRVYVNLSPYDLYPRDASATLNPS